MPAPQQRQRHPERSDEGEDIAADLVGALNRGAEEITPHYVDRDERGQNGDGRARDKRERGGDVFDGPEERVHVCQPSVE